MSVGKTSRLSSSKLLGGHYATEEDPMSSMGNLMDVMLVFACGLMIALIAHYNVDFTPESADTGNVEKLEQELVNASQGITNSDSNFAEVGSVYRDTTTGELYIVAPNGTESSE
jgi:hypothetical protein